MEAPESKTGQALLRVDADEDAALRDGLYFLAVFSLAVEGLRQRRMFEVFAWVASEGSVLSGDAAERLLHLVMMRGEEWAEEDAAAAMSDEIFDALTDAALARASSMRQQEQRENEALYIRRKQTLVAEFERAAQSQRQRIATAEARGNKRILPAMRGQLQKMQVIHEDKLTDLEKARDLVVQMFDEPVALCAVRVQRLPAKSLPQRVSIA
jgi:hypothetical protein